MSEGRVHPASVNEVRDEIQAISHSRLFAQSRRRIELLEYLCNMVLLGRQDEIKESTIALELFDRTSEFDDKKDAIVRVEAHRLRQRLAKYYATEGLQDRLVIELMPGGYIPRFIVRAPEQVEPPTPLVAASPVQQSRFVAQWNMPHWRLIAGAAVMLAFAFGSVALSHRGAARGPCFGCFRVQGAVDCSIALVRGSRPHSRREFQTLHGSCGPPMECR